MHWIGVNGPLILIMNYIYLDLVSDLFSVAYYVGRWTKDTQSIVGKYLVNIAQTRSDQLNSRTGEPVS